jgi:hypothetical protein
MDHVTIGQDETDPGVPLESTLKGMVSYLCISNHFIHIHVCACTHGHICACTHTHTHTYIYTLHPNGCFSSLEEENSLIVLLLNFIHFV